MPPQRIQILSDIHLEFPVPPAPHQYATYTIPPSAPYLLLCGDVGLLSQLPLFTAFLQRIAQDFTRVFLVLGNHEFYHLTRSAGLAAAAELERALPDGKLTVLHRRRVDLAASDVTILGCTLHSRLDPTRRARIARGLNDFALVGEWGPDEYDAEFVADLNWLRREVARAAAQGRRVVVATHHAPTRGGTSDPVHAGSPFESCFASGVLEEEVAAWDGVKVWAFGHTHWCCDFVTEGGVRVVANQGGYPMEVTGDGATVEGERRRFEKGFVVEV